jgi:uncharacterized repeat protein (TIGR04052 family)
MRNISIVAALSLLAACHGKHEDSAAEHDHDHEHGDEGTDGTDGADGADGADGGDNVAAIALRFGAVVGAAPFACGQTFTIDGSELTPKDLRFFVSEPVALMADGGEVALTVSAVETWQDGVVGLIDFEDATGACSSGSGPTRSTLEVSGPAGPWAGLRFTVGVPFAHNHIDAASAGAPLNTSAMFWSWASGYKFLKLDGITAGMPGGLSLHVGSTGCEADDAGTVTSCANPNRAVIELRPAGGFDPDAHEVVLDVATLLAGMALESNTPDTAPGCMSAPNDPECVAPFAHLGLPLGEDAGGAQNAFSAR